MTTRLELLQRWEAGLEANATPTDEESRFHWLRRVYVRIYSFLISRYASGDWRADSAADASEDDAELATSPMPHVDNTAEVTGLQPKSNEQIRGKLAAIRDANDDRQPPGTTAGLSVNEWVAVASCKNRKTAERIRTQLVANGFQVVKTKRTTDYCIEVRYGSFEEALSVLQDGDRRASPKTIRSFRIVRTTDRPLSRGVRLLALIGVMIGGLGCCVFTAIIVNDAVAYFPRETFLLVALLVAGGLFFALLPRLPR
jgi:hypothetical protein